MESRNPLAIAIKNNSYEEVEKFLKQGHKLVTKDFYDAFVQVFQDNTIKPEIMDLLDTYHALPTEVSVATIKFILFLEGNNKIQPKDFMDKPDLNLNGCPGLQTPMEISARQGLESNARFLIKAGVQERPLYYLFNGIHESHFRCLDLLDIRKFKERIAKKLSGKDTYLRDDIEEQCQIAELFITHPTDSLYSEIEEESKSSYGKFQFLPFFAWAAKNNRADLLHTECFSRLLVKYPEAAEESLKIAVAFGAKDYVKDALISMGKETVRTAMSIASASHDQDMLVCIVNMLSQLGLSLKNISHDSVTRGDSSFGSIDDDEPLFWAIRCDNNEAVTYLLQNGVDPNDYRDAFSEESYLNLAIRMGNIEVVKMLLDHGANLECMNTLQQTPLYEAIEHKRWDIAFMLIEKYNANIHAIDYKKKTPLDYVKDQEIKNKILLLSKPQESIHKEETTKKGNISMKINIVGLSKADVLLNLYNKATCSGPAFASQPMMRVLASMASPAKPEAAEKEIKKRMKDNNFYFDYIDLGSGPKPLKVDLSGFEFNSKLYDEYHGEGAAKKIISGLRNKIISEFSKDDKNSFSYLLSKINSAIQNEEKNGSKKDKDEDLEVNYSPRF